MIKHYDVIVIGGGASGMIAAIKAAEKKLKVLLIEKNQSLGRKLLATGNGRCNLLNHGTYCYYGNSDFASTVLQHCTADQLILFFKKYGLMLKEEKDGRMYPATFQSSTVVSVLKMALTLHHAEIALYTKVKTVRKERNFIVISEDDHYFNADRLILACGGCAQPKLGGSQDGYKFLKGFGHYIHPVFPSLVPVITDQKSISGLSGIRVRCSVAVFDNLYLLYRTSGELLFTQYGISGICVMQCSRFLHKNGTHIEVDFIQDMFEDESAAFDELIRRRFLFHDFSPVKLMEGIVNEHLSYAILKQAGIPLRGENAGDLSDDDLRRIVNKSYHYCIHVQKTHSFDYAQVTAGGADCNQFNPSSMESLLVPGLYATGEVLNVDGDCGGFNLMFAFSSGYIAGISC